MSDQLVLEFIDETHIIDRDGELTFGRQGDVVIDDNKYLHRILGRIVYRDGTWWLGNVGTAIAMQVADGDGQSYTRLAPGASVPIAFPWTKVTFEAGGASYELDIRIEGSVPDLELDGLDREFSEATETAVSIALSDDQRLLLTALAESRLRPTGDDALPTNRQVASRFDWTITKFNRKLDSLCRKFSRAGVRGLQGTSDGVARDRRQRLVDYVLDAGIIGVDDLTRLDPPRPD